MQLLSVLIRVGLIVCAVVLTGCGRENPAAVVERVRQAAKASDWGAVYDALDQATQRLMDEGAKLGGGGSGRETFIRQARANALQRPELGLVIAERVEGDAATVTVRHLGTTRTEDLKLVREQGRWKLNMLSAPIVTAVSAPARRVADAPPPVSRDAVDKLIRNLRVIHQALYSSAIMGRSLYPPRLGELVRKGIVRGEDFRDPRKPDPASAFADLQAAAAFADTAGDFIYPHHASFGPDMNAAAPILYTRHVIGGEVAVLFADGRAQMQDLQTFRQTLAAAREIFGKAHALPEPRPLTP